MERSQVAAPDAPYKVEHLVHVGLTGCVVACQAAEWRREEAHRTSTAAGLCRPHQRAGTASVQPHRARRGVLVVIGSRS